MTKKPLPSDLEALILAHFDGSLTQEQESRLAIAISTSAEAKQLFLSYMRMEGRLHSLGLDGFLREPDLSMIPVTDETEHFLSGKNIGQLFKSGIFRITASLAAAIFLIAALCWSLYPEPVYANVVLNKAERVASLQVDRTYLLTISDLISETPTEREFEIDMRGGGMFFVRPRTSKYRMGSDGALYWFSRDNSKFVMVTEDYEALSPELLRRIPNLGIVKFMNSPKQPLILNLPSLLEYVKESYDIDLLKSEKSRTQHLRATPRNAGPSTTRTIELWIDSESNVLKKVEMRTPGRRNWRLELLSSEPLPDSWYRYNHHFPNREVSELSSESTGLEN